MFSITSRVVQYLAFKKPNDAHNIKLRNPTQQTIEHRSNIKHICVNHICDEKKRIMIYSKRCQWRFVEKKRCCPYWVPREAAAVAQKVDHRHADEAIDVEDQIRFLNTHIIHINNFFLRFGVGGGWFEASGGTVVVWWWCGGGVVVVWWWCGGVVVWRCGGVVVVVVVWWCDGGVVVQWCDGVVVVWWWCGGGVAVWWCGGVVVWWCGGGVVLVWSEDWGRWWVVWGGGKWGVGSGVGHRVGDDGVVEVRGPRGVGCPTFEVVIFSTSQAESSRRGGRHVRGGGAWGGDGRVRGDVLGPGCGVVSDLRGGDLLHFVGVVEQEGWPTCAGWWGMRGGRASTGWCAGARAWGGVSHLRGGDLLHFVGVVEQRRGGEAAASVLVQNHHPLVGVVHLSPRQPSPSPRQPPSPSRQPYDSAANERANAT